MLSLAAAASHGCSNTTRHLAEFWMVEPELAFASAKDAADLAELLVRTVRQLILVCCSPLQLRSPFAMCTVECGQASNWRRSNSCTFVGRQQSGRSTSRRLANDLEFAPNFCGCAAREREAPYRMPCHRMRSRVGAAGHPGGRGGSPRTAAASLDVLEKAVAEPFHRITCALTHPAPARLERAMQSLPNVLHRRCCGTLHYVGRVGRVARLVPSVGTDWLSPHWVSASMSVLGKWPTHPCASSIGLACKGTRLHCLRWLRRRYRS
jgi:hypothetical protein